jgi:hypothetical protein
MQLVEDTAAILKAPFSGKLDLYQLFLIVGLVLIFATAWALLLNHIRSAAMELV